MRPMISRALLKKAVEQNLLRQDQLEPLYQFLQNPPGGEADQSATLPDNSQPEQQEPLRFIRSFGDVFISLGIILLVVAMNRLELSGLLNLLPVAGLVLLAEWLVRLKRLVLPGMVILVCILYFVNRANEFNYQDAAVFDLAVLSITSLLYYARYRIPFSLLPFAAGLVAIAVIEIGFDMLNQPILFAVLGLVVFAVAFWLDTMDTRRISHLSDSAFWLHLLAAPLIVHGVMVNMLISDNQWLNAFSAEVMIMAFFLVFFLLALLIDRRAMLVSTQLYMIYALTQVFQGQQGSGEDAFIYVLIAVGIFVIYFGTYWYKTRRLLFGFLAGTVINRYVPDVRLVPQGK